MTFDHHPTLHRVRAAELEHEAAVSAATRGLRRARRLELAARLLARLARRLEARAGVSRTRLL